MFKLINGGEKFPERATRYSCGFDVFANEDVVIGAGETKLVGMGIALDVTSNMQFMSTSYFALHIHQSLRAKGLTSLGTGIINMDDRDEIKMVVNNPYIPFHHDYPNHAEGFEIKKGDKIGQLILCKHEGWLLPSEYTKDEERTGGFGSTGNE